MKGQGTRAGKHYRNLKVGERLQIDDEIFTRASADYEPNWVVITAKHMRFLASKVIDEGHVPARRPIK
jgi:hypothetical protein